MPIPLADRLIRRFHATFTSTLHKSEAAAG
jgi:hypothetical protein